MKSTMPFYGISMPEVRVITRRVSGPTLACDELRQTVTELWRGARRREERYAAQILLGVKRNVKCLTPRDMPMLEDMVVTGAWWNLVDEAINEGKSGWVSLIARAASPQALLPFRCAVEIVRVAFHRHHLVTLGDACCGRGELGRPGDPRQYAWTDAKEVARYVRQNEARLTGFSRREALKNIG